MRQMITVSPLRLAGTLRELDMHAHRLCSLEGIDRFINLRRLSVTSNRIAEAALRLPRLHSLNLSDNRLTTFPGLSGCSALHVYTRTHWNCHVALLQPLAVCEPRH